MKERPILMNAPMVRAILAGTKTQTRRIIDQRRTPYHDIAERDDGSLWPWRENNDTAQDHWYPCPFGVPGDRLWVRETWQRAGGGTGYWYAATDSEVDDGESPVSHWRPSIHMPRVASRITLEITGARVERLLDISEADAQAEGAPFELGKLEALILGAKAKYRSGFVRLWESIHGGGSWVANPWVWVVEFRRVDAEA